MHGLRGFETKLFWGLIAVWLTGSAGAAALPDNRVSDVRNTRHNFSASVTPNLPGGGGRVVVADTEQQICVFCHTPHGANVAFPSPLWNRQLSQATYKLYDSTSMDAVVNQPGGTSKLCLSCHDGTLAIGSVNVLNGTYAKQPIQMQGTDQGKMPPGEGATTGFTRNLGLDLSNDHPISFTFDSNLAIKDGELRDPVNVSYIGDRSVKRKPVVPLEQGQVQCNACHDPHIRAKNNDVNIKFLRLNRFQQQEPTGSLFQSQTDIICLACHDKAGWVGSAHAHAGVANEQYTQAAAVIRDFPDGTLVWQAACLNCHDTHTVQGSRRLLREGVVGGLTSSGVKLGATQPGIEETCYACHSSDGTTLTRQGKNTEVPDIKSDFQLARHMPITNQEQGNSVEVHSIGTGPTGQSQTGKDLLEDPSFLGNNNRHAECTDCHNPHRVIKNRLFNADFNNPDAAGTHEHEGVSLHTNLASGVLRGTWGVEPVNYSSQSFYALPSSFDVKRGNPPVSASTHVSNSYVTREYQVCMKCHSNYAYGTTPPNLGMSTPQGAAFPPGMHQYTNQAQEYQAPAAHKGEGISLGVAGGASASFNTNNHRGWHPVMDNTGRTSGARGGADADLFRPPFNANGAMGNQTLYCSDCHGSNTEPGTTDPDPVPGDENGNPWGPHGSDNNFILKGAWNERTGTGSNGDICFKCHDYNQYANPSNNSPLTSGYRRNGGGGMCINASLANANLHIGHANRIGRLRCNWCHIAVPHGWKNKALLVNLNDVGPEAGFSTVGNSVSENVTGGGFNSAYTQAPYYNNAKLRVQGFASSGNWVANNCGGVMWMMQSCSNPP